MHLAVVASNLSSWERYNQSRSDGLPDAKTAVRQQKASPYCLENGRSTVHISEVDDAYVL